VAARTSCFAFKGRSEDIRRIGTTLGVDTVLEGSVRKADNKLRITTQLINVADGFRLWSQSFDREMQDVLRSRMTSPSDHGSAEVALERRQGPAIRQVTAEES